MMEEPGSGDVSANHLCVLVHGAWGTPDHMNQVAKAIRDTYPEDQLHLLLAKRNSGYFTYDGIELGGERVCDEIEDEIEAIHQNGGHITKLSIVGYSLGGLVARYAIGLLYAKGVLDRVEPMNFTTFASPHLGVRAPLSGWYDHVWNNLGSRVLSESGRQLFIVDKFRDTGRPLLSILAEPDSIFVLGLKKFKRRTLYSNILNDRTVAHYTSMITQTDPYIDLTKIKARYARGYEDVVLDREHPVTQLAPEAPKSTMSLMAINGASYVKNSPYVLALAIFLPIGITVFLLNSAVQTVRSTRRIQLHENGKAGIQVEKYRMPLWVEEIQGTVENAYENINSSQKQAYLTASPDDDDDDERILEPAEAEILDLESQQSQPRSPTLALDPCQFEMITSLNAVGWRKFPVWIKNVRHTHAAIIVRMDKPSFSEGLIVLKHWLSEEFMM
ncbi:putative serine esterase-domain-containing protein [Astrocystis sublimbata]|nr:putative serine esterase-domain-containing protein [Astrocystis sublimbata]